MVESNITKQNIKNMERTLSYKRPTSTLLFKESEIGRVRAICKGYDGFFYLVNDTNGLIEKHESITSNDEPLETGYEWNVQNLGLPIRIVHLPEGLIVVTTIGETGSRQGRIYHLPTINSTPNLVYETPQGEDTYFVSTFGFDFYTNGLHSIILVGAYGRNSVERDLLLSVDGGQTFDVVKKSSNNDPDPNINSHWHDVAVDVYNGFLWASEGDGSLNRGVHFSDDLGETWHTLAKGVAQPTSILPFPKKTVFGNDTEYVGLRYFHRPSIMNDYENLEIEPLYKIMPNRTGSLYYAQSPVIDGNEAYLTFSVANQQQPSLILGTGDFGESWYSLSISYTDDPIVSRPTLFWGIDDKYIYALGTGVGAVGNQVLYAKKPIWI